MKPSAQKVHAFMLDYQEKSGRPPTLAEIAAAIPLAGRSSAAYTVRVLVANGLARIVGTARQSRRFVAVAHGSST